MTKYTPQQIAAADKLSDAAIDLWMNLRNGNDLPVIDNLVDDIARRLRDVSDLLDIQATDVEPNDEENCYIVVGNQLIVNLDQVDSDAVYWIDSADGAHSITFKAETGEEADYHFVKGVDHDEREMAWSELSSLIDTLVAPYHIYKDFADFLYVRDLSKKLSDAVDAVYGFEVDRNPSVPSVEIEDATLTKLTIDKDWTGVLADFIKASQPKPLELKLDPPKDMWKTDMADFLMRPYRPVDWKSMYSGGWPYGGIAVVDGAVGAVGTPGSYAAGLIRDDDVKPAKVDFSGADTELMAAYTAKSSDGSKIADFTFSMEGIMPWTYNIADSVDVAVLRIARIDPDEDAVVAVKIADRKIVVDKVVEAKNPKAAQIVEFYNDLVEQLISDGDGLTHFNAKAHIIEAATIRFINSELFPV